MLMPLEDMSRQCCGSQFLGSNRNEWKTYRLSDARGRIQVKACECMLLWLLPGRQGQNVHLHNTSMQ